jgi:hypothetical protein
VFETTLSKYDAYGERPRVATTRLHSHTALRIHQHCNRHSGHFARTDPCGLGRGEGYGDPVVTFLEGAKNATLDVVAEILGLPGASLPPRLLLEISIPIPFGGMGVGDLAALADAAHVGAAGFAMGSAIRFLTTRAWGFPRRSSDGADHVRTASDGCDHIDVPQG